MPTTTVSPTLAASRATHTRLRLQRVLQVRGRESVRLRFSVVSSATSAGSAGRAIVRIDGEKVASRSVRVTLKKGRYVVGPVYRVPSSLSLGRHRITVSFKATRDGGFRSSASRPVTLTVVRQR